MSLESCRHLADEHGGECLTDAFPGWRTKLRWRCSEGHEWEALYGNIKYGRWCPTCRNAAGGRKKMGDNLRRAQEVAATHGGRCLAEENAPMSALVDWACAFSVRKKHEWCAVLTSVINNSTWCPKCALASPARQAQRKDNLARAQELAAKRGG